MQLPRLDVSYEDGQRPWDGRDGRDACAPRPGVHARLREQTLEPSPGLEGTDTEFKLPFPSSPESRPVPLL